MFVAGRRHPGCWQRTMEVTRQSHNILVSSSPHHPNLQSYLSQYQSDSRAKQHETNDIPAVINIFHYEEEKVSSRFEHKNIKFKVSYVCP